MSHPLMIDREFHAGTATDQAFPPTSPSRSPHRMAGRSWQRGTSQTSTWSYTGSPGPDVKIVLFKGGTEVDTIAGSVQIGSTGTGSCTGPFYPTGTTGSDYTVRIESISQPTITDTSDNSLHSYVRTTHNHHYRTSRGRGLATRHFSHRYLGLFKQSRALCKDSAGEGRC